MVGTVVLILAKFRLSYFPLTVYSKLPPFLQLENEVMHQDNVFIRTLQLKKEAENEEQAVTSRKLLSFFSRYVYSLRDVRIYKGNLSYHDSIHFVHVQEIIIVD